MEHQDAELLRALQDEHGHALFAHAVRLSGGDRQRAEDLVQETMLRAWRYPQALDPKRETVRSWLFTTARNLAIDAWRRRSARVGEVVTDVMPEPPPSADEADRAVEAWTVAEALRRLSRQHREVLVECFYQGRSVAEAAAAPGDPGPADPAPGAQEAAGTHPQHVTRRGRGGAGGRRRRGVLAGR